MPGSGIETHDDSRRRITVWPDGSVTITFPNEANKKGISQTWLKPECWKTICANFSVVKELPLKPNRRDAVVQARKMYPDGTFAVIVTTALELAGLDPDDEEARRRMCGLVNEMKELKQA